MPNRKVPKSVTEIEMAASSKAINKTISELETLLEGDRISADCQLRDKLHKKLFDLLRSEARAWYKRGFKRGHQTCHNEGENVPINITRRMVIKAPYLSEKGESVILKSEIKKIKIKIKKKKV